MKNEKPRGRTLALAYVASTTRFCVARIDTRIALRRARQRARCFRRERLRARHRARASCGLDADRVINARVRQDLVKRERHRAQLFFATISSSAGAMAEGRMSGALTRPARPGAPGACEDIGRRRVQRAAPPRSRVASRDAASKPASKSSRRWRPRRLSSRGIILAIADLRVINEPVTSSKIARKSAACRSPVPRFSYPGAAAPE